jgi:sialate O-acetylesterase
MKNPIAILVFLAMVAPHVARAELRLARIFTDNMLLQRDQPVRVWGWAAAGENVKVSFAGREAAATADAGGKWAVELPALKGGENLTLTAAGRNSVTLTNIVMGDIWLCAGQSNMEMALGRCLGAEEDIKAADLPKIRRIKFQHMTSAYPEDEAPTAGPWQVCAPAVAGSFTAAGFYFAREVLQRTGVPIGILDDNWGGSPIERWTPIEGLEMMPVLKPVLDARRKALADCQAGMPQAIDGIEQWVAQARAMLKQDAGARLPPPPSLPSPVVAGNWCDMHNAMVQPLVRLPIKGVLWYQGEANGGDGDNYRDKMQTLIGGWRKLWDLGDFPFYFVQLTLLGPASVDPAGGNGWARLRMAQTKALAIPHTGMAVIIDIGDADDIHPRNKYDVGLRLARWALARDYGFKDMVVSGPIFREMKLAGGQARLSFDHVGTGLMVGKKTGREPTAEEKDGKLACFAVAGADKVWQWADAVIEGDTVVVSSPKVAAPVAVRYAFAMNPAGANFYNREGLPASPFRTDNW